MVVTKQKMDVILLSDFVFDYMCTKLCLSCQLASTHFGELYNFAMMCNNASECFIYFLLFKTHLRRSSLLLLWFFLSFAVEGVAGCVPTARLPG